jgi:hypothetical protein
MEEPSMPSALMVQEPERNTGLVSTDAVSRMDTIILEVELEFYRFETAIECVLTAWEAR